MGDRKWDLREASDILTTVSEEINIIVPAKDANPAVYIDVSLDSILEVSLDKAFVTDSQHLTYGLIIQLMVGTTTNCILNATEYAGRHVALAFASEKDANTLRRLLMPTSVRANGFPPHSQSGAIDGSEPILPDDELAAPGSALSHRQNLMRTASLASAMIPHKAAASTSNPLSLKLVHTLQRASAEHQKWSSRSMIEHDEDSQRVGHNVEMAEEGIDVSYNGSLVEQAIEGIDVSQNDGLNHEEIQYRDAQAHVPDNASSNARIRHSQVPSNGALAPLGNSDQNSSTGLSSSLRWRTNPNTTKNAPELRTPQQAVSYVEPVENKIRPISQDPEHDDLFDASPKVKDGQRKSPRIIARDNVPKQLDRSLEPNTREAGDKTGPPAKLSRQLRNANGVVGSRTLQTADDNLTTPTKIGAGVVKISANSKNGKSSVYTKLRTVAESTKSTKKTAQTRGQAFATEESPTASHNIYDFSPSPTRVDSIIQTSVKKKEATTTRPKATKAARNNRKQAKPVPTKATATTSSKGPAAQPEKGTKDKARANGMTQDSIPSRSNGKRADDDDDAIWDVDQTHSEEKTRDPRQSRQPAKTAKKQEVPIPKTKKKKVQTQPHSDEAKANKATKTTKAQTQAPTARVMQLKPAPAALSQLRPRRAAAIKANKKIQGLYESDEIVDDEEVTPALTRSSPHASSDAVKALRIQKVRNGGDKRATSSGKLPTARILAKDSISDSVSPDYSDEQRVDSVSNPKDDNSPEKVDLVRDPSAEALPAAPGDTRDSSTKENLTSLAETPMIPLHSGHGDRSIQPNPTSAEKVAEVNEARVNLMSGSVPQLYESITETELAPPRPQENNYAEQGDLDATKQAGPGDQDQVEHVLPYLYDVSLELNSKPDRVQEEVGPPQAPTAPVLVELRQRRAPPRLAEAPPKPLPESTATKRDPFGAKLNALMPELKDTNAKFKSREGDAHVESKGSSATKPAELARSSRVPEAGAFENLEATSLEEAKQVENPPRYLKSAMQVDGEGRDSRFQTLKPARESISASSGENKRRTEQTGKISIKRVKLAPQDRLEGASARRELTYDTKETPPPVVSKRPLVIGFSKTGPRNQGSVSTKNPKPPKDVGNGAPGAVKLRQHDVPIPMTFQVEAGFAPVPETLEKSSEDIQDNAKNADGAQKEIRGSPQRKQAEHLTIVNAVAAREANAQEHRAQKRKLAPAPDEPAPWEHEQLSKRQKRDIETPPTVQNHHPKLLPDISPALVHDRSQRVSSQNTRVNENGSPMPFVVTHGEKIAAEEQYSDEDDGKNALAEARLEEQIVLQDDGPILPEPMLPLRPLVPTDSISQLKTTTYECLSNNSKQLPSSPHAPSVFGTMPPHHIYHDGEIVNVETNESIIPVNPQDPFLGATENPRNSFMIALRKSTENAAKRLISGANDRRGSGGVFVRPSLNVGEDPDKTLVAPSLRKKYKQDHVLESSSSSASGSSLRASQPDESSEEEIDEETETKWRKGLEPHQENMLECLLTISHVSNYI